jgi:hypothetical protein
MKTLILLLSLCIPLPAVAQAIPDGAVVPLALADGTLVKTTAFLGYLQYVDGAGVIQTMDIAVTPHGTNPNPPNPPQPPTPPTPPNPVAPQTLRVLLMYESDALVGMKPAQEAILVSPKIREYLAAHCPSETLSAPCPTGICPTGTMQSTTMPSFRFLDKDANTSRMPVVWQQTVAALRAKNIAPPSILICTTKGEAFSGPWPATVDEMLALLKKYGGP